MKQWEEKLKQSGRRMTQTRKHLMDIFGDNQSPLSIEDMKKHLTKKGWNGDTVTLYRQVQTLLKEDLIEISDIPGRKRRYENKKDHHHHFVCLKCKKTQCIEKESIEKEIFTIIEKIQSKGVYVKNHSFSLSGICKQCNYK